MHLTRLSLDLRSAQVRRDLADSYEMHRTLVRAFVTTAEQAPPRILWRPEPAVAGGDPIVLVQAASIADWSVLEKNPAYFKKPPETKKLDLAQLLVQGERYRFRLFANPTVSRDGKRYGLTTEEAQVNWLCRQGERHGFEVEYVVVIASDLLTSRKDEMRIHLQRACFEGVLRVADPARLGSAMAAGIGPGKAFGCGLLSLARCR